MNARKARQLRSQGGQKRYRRGLKKNRATAAEFNAAQEAIAAEWDEAQAWQAEVVETLSKEPQFAILDPFTGRVLMQVAASMIYPLDADAAEADPAASKVVLPTGVLAAEADRQREEGTPFADTSVIESELLTP